MGKRLFVAVDMPDQVNQNLADYAEVLRDVRWYEASDFHLTLKFIGEVDGEKMTVIQRQLEKVVMAPFELTIDRLGYFPPDRHPRVIWAGFDASESLHRLHDDIEDKLEQVGIKKESREYTPHITLGKNKGVPKTRVETYIERRNDIYIPDIPVDSFILYSSELTSNGAVHTPEKEYCLQKP